MACNCNKGKTGFDVVATNGKVVFSSTSKATADAIGKRYPGSKVVEKGTKSATAPVAPAVATAAEKATDSQ